MILSHHKMRELNQDPLEKGSQYFYLRSLHRNQVWCPIDVNQALGRLWYRNDNFQSILGYEARSCLGNLKTKKVWKREFCANSEYQEQRLWCRCCGQAALPAPPSGRALSLYPTPLPLLSPAQTEGCLSPEACPLAYSCWSSNQDIYHPLFMPAKIPPHQLQDLKQCPHHTSSWHPPCLHLLFLLDTAVL